MVEVQNFKVNEVFVVNYMRTEYNIKLIIVFNALCNFDGPTISLAIERGKSKR